MHGALAGSRTPNLLIRSQVLYPIKLQARRESIPPLPMSEKSAIPSQKNNPISINKTSPFANNKMRVNNNMERSIKIWLMSVMALIAAIIVVGGITRLTGSGLSMVDWRPVFGILPPITNSQWLEVFTAYKSSPEYLKINQGMNLSEFKFIFFWGILTPYYGSFNWTQCTHPIYLF